MSYLCRRTNYTSCREAGIKESPLSRADSLFRRFHRFPPSVLVSKTCDRTVPKVLVRLGALKGLIYSSDRGKPGKPRSFIHFMQSPPVLACDPQGRRLFIIGGNYRVTPFGIEG